MRLTQNVELWNTPGHTAQDLSVIVRNVPCCGTVAVVGDLIYSEHDVFNYTEWYYDAWNPKIGLNNRNKVICCVDWIVPGHGKMFKVTQEMRYRANCTGGFVPTTTLPPPSTAQPTWTWTWDPTSTAPTTTTVDPTTPTITPSTTTTSTTTTATTTTTTPAPTTPEPTTTTLEHTTASKYITVDYHWNNRINDVPTESTTLPTPPPTTTTPAPPAPVRVVAPVPPPLSYVAAPPTHLGYFAPCALTTIHPCPAAFLAPSANSNQLLYPVLQQLVDYAEPGSRAVPTHASGYFNLIGKAFKKFAGDHRITAEISPKMAK
ncbi:hypothetical protein L596_014501 [Steinernema carpocapsae]|uniref:Metallo-beta-lactamase domain-containing protein n=1 Tax=Steinernema carpocapsae TaxID=34508 RepID=A0A4U5NC42_STECR|nr:hypothetical protein L596_014501 [Steinernema carpocapsae]